MSNQVFDYKGIFDVTSGALALLDKEYRVILANDSYCDRVGVARDDLIGACVLEVFDADIERKNAVRGVFDKALSGQPSAMRELYYPISDPNDPTGPATDRWWTFDCIPMPPHLVYGQIFLINIEDVTQTILALKRRDRVAAELRHRIGNLLTLVQIIARWTARSSANLKGFMQAYESRVNALGRAHSFLAGDNFDGMSMQQAIEQQLEKQKPSRDGKINISGPDWTLSVTQAQIFALALRELFSNAASFGAWSQPGGTINVSWAYNTKGGFDFDWVEEGLTNLSPPTTTGFGLQMIGHLLPDQMGGSATYQFAPSGFHYNLSLTELNDPIITFAPQKQEDSGARKR